uniref:Somatostatin receptor type 1 subtype A-like protein n=1 Tax=Adineta vaga TaxID=104782 RepID=B3G4J6_ADIVA|nr:somatostatin receptor type 1 subtype A-like protein [Adineta vaga]
MSTSTVLTLDIAGQQVVIYGGSFLFITGVIGGPLMLITLLSLRTFRENSCAFYLIIMSIVNTLNLFIALLTFIMTTGFGINWLNISRSFCKFRPFYLQFGNIMSFICICLATIDQFLATCSHPRWHQYNRITIARQLILGAIGFCLFHGIPFLLYYDLSFSVTSGTYTCGFSKISFQTYFNVFHFPILITSLPVIIILIFGCLAFRNVRHISYRTIPLVRRELDKQLTTMVLAEALSEVIFVTPTIILNLFNYIIGSPNDPLVIVLISFFRNLTGILYYIHFVVRIICINII